MQRMEEIGKEDAWFKSDKNQVEVSVAPGGRWSRFKAYSTIQRTLEIWGFFLKFIVKAWLDNQKFTYRGGMTEEKKVLRRKALAKWLKENILRLGPTFIKIGQQLSTRVDILLQEYVDQLSELQDQVPPFPSETAVSIVKEELGVPLDDIFDRFDNEPIAAASLGQAHRARLKGQEVVVKVQRPGLKDLFDIDLKNLRVHSRTKHIGLRYHFIRSLLEDDVLISEKIQGNKNPTDMLTKAVAAGTLVNLATILYIISIRVPAIIAYTFCAIFGFQVLFGGIIKVKKLDERERLMTGTA